MAEIKATNTTWLSNRTMKTSRRISLEEIEERRSKGICLFCDEPETPNHYRRHKNSKIHMIEGDEDQFQNDEDQFQNDEIEFESKVSETESSNHVELIQQLEISDCAEISSQITLDLMPIPKPELIHAKMKVTQDQKTNSMPHLSSNQTAEFENEVPDSKLEPSLRFHNESTVSKDVHSESCVDVLLIHQEEKLQVLGVLDMVDCCEKSAIVKIKSVAHQMFERMLHREHSLQHQRKKGRVSKSWKFKFKPAKDDIKHKHSLRILLCNEQHEFMGRQKTMCKMGLRQDSWELPQYRSGNKKTQRRIKCKFKYLRLMDQPHKSCLLYKLKRLKISRGSTQFFYDDVQFFLKDKWRLQEQQTDSELKFYGNASIVIFICYEDYAYSRLQQHGTLKILRLLQQTDFGDDYSTARVVQFEIKHKWRSKFLSPVSKLVLCFDNVELSTSYANLGDCLWMRWSFTVAYEYSHWDQNDKRTKILCSKRLVVYKLGGEAKTVSGMYQHVVQLIQMEFAKGKRLLDVTQSQAFDPGIRLESQDILRSVKLQFKSRSIFSKNIIQNEGAPKDGLIFQQITSMLIL